MTRLIRAEALHLRSRRSTYGTAFAVVALAVVIIAAEISEGFDSAAKAREAFMASTMLIPAFAFGLFAAARTASEFRYGTIAHRALAAPRRAQLVAAKLIVLAAFAVLVTAVTVTAGVITAAVMNGAGDPALHLSVANVAELLAGTTLFAGLGVAVGFLSRNQTTAVLIVFGVWLAEQLIQGFMPATALPYGLLGAFAQDEALAGLGLLAITGAALAAASAQLNRKDLI